METLCIFEGSSEKCDDGADEGNAGEYRIKKGRAEWKYLDVGLSEKCDEGNVGG